MTNMLLDTGTDVSANNESFAKRIRLERSRNDHKEIVVQGIGRSNVTTTARTMVKITLGQKVIYAFEVGIIPYHAHANLISVPTFLFRPA